MGSSPKRGPVLAAAHGGVIVGSPPPRSPAAVSPSACIHGGHCRGSWIKSGSWHPRYPVFHPPRHGREAGGLQPGQGSRRGTPARWGRRVKPSGHGDARRLRASPWHGRHDLWGGLRPRAGVSPGWRPEGVRVSRPSSRRPALGRGRGGLGHGQGGRGAILWGSWVGLAVPRHGRSPAGRT